jgi:hypothetical protein
MPFKMDLIEIMDTGYILIINNPLVNLYGKKGLHMYLTVLLMFSLENVRQEI